MIQDKKETYIQNFELPVTLSTQTQFKKNFFVNLKPHSKFSVPITFGLGVT